MNLDKYDERYHIDQNTYMQKIPRIEKFIGLFELYVSVWRATFVIGSVWALMVIASFSKRHNSEEECYLCFWIFCIILPLASVLWGFWKNKRSFLAPPTVILVLVIVVALFLTISELAIGNPMT